MIVRVWTTQNQSDGFRDSGRAENWHGRCLLCEVQRTLQWWRPFRGSIKQAIRLADVRNDFVTAVMTQFERGRTQGCGRSNSFSFGQRVSGSARSSGKFASMLSRPESAVEPGFQGALTVWIFPELPVQARLCDGWEAARSLWNSDHK